MIPNKLGMAIILSMFISNYALAGDKVCNYPKHIKIDGPPGTAIMRLNLYTINDKISLMKTSETSFDIINKFDCKYEGARYIFLKVGTDSNHYSTHLLRTESEGSSNLYHLPIEKEKFTLSTIDKTNDTDYKLTFTYKNNFGVR